MQLVAPHGWGNPAGRVSVGTPAGPVLPLEGAGRGGNTMCTMEHIEVPHLVEEELQTADGGLGVQRCPHQRAHEREPRGRPAVAIRKSRVRVS